MTEVICVMSDDLIDFDADLSGLSKPAWLKMVDEISEEHGYLEHLGNRHATSFIDLGKTLIVSFETFETARTMLPEAHPISWTFSKTLGWSSLTLLCDGDTWFRDDTVYRYFDRLVDEGFLEDFDDVIFYGAGSCAYAAAALSVTCPGAKVLALAPQATLAPSSAGWDDRYRPNRRLDFKSRYGFAPDMIDAAEKAYIVYDPTVKEDAMHACLFSTPNVTHLAAPRLGSDLQKHFWEMGVLEVLISEASSGRLDANQFARHMRARRDHLPYLRRLLAELIDADRAWLQALLCKNTGERLDAPRFRKRYIALTGEDPSFFDKAKVTVNA